MHRFIEILIIYIIVPILGFIFGFISVGLLLYYLIGNNIIIYKSHLGGSEVWGIESGTHIGNPINVS